MFPMRSVSSFRLQLGCAIGVLVLAACSPEADRKLPVQNQHQAMRSAKLYERPHTQSAAAVTAPVSDAMHFDLDCDLHGRVVSWGDPEIVHGTYPANEARWHSRSHYIIDLQSMQFCEASVCAEYPLFRIVRVTPDRIVLDDRPGSSESIRRRDWYYEQRADEDRISVTRGSCRRVAFSGFPIRAAGR
jgi:hypothetical protein